MKLLFIGVGGMAGALSRYWVDGLVTRATRAQFPWGTLVVNVSGSLLLGFVFALLTGKSLPHPDLRSGLTIGFIGAYTTFSTFVLETVMLADEGAKLAALTNVAASVIAGLVAVWLGLAAGRAL